MYDEKSVAAFGESWRHWDNTEGCKLDDRTVLPQSKEWFNWVDGLQNRPNSDLPTCSDQQECIQNNDI